MTAVGLLPGSLMPVIILAARERLGFSTAQAASLGAADLYGVAAGALMMALCGMPGRWRTIAAMTLLGLAAVDLASASTDMFAPLLALRTARGVLGGVLVGIGYGAIGRSAAPDRLFGALMVVQFAIGGAALALLPTLVLARGMWLIFYILATAALLSLGCVRFLPAIGVDRTAPTRGSSSASNTLAWGLMALFLAEAGHTAGSAFVLELGRESGLPLSKIQSLAGLAGVAGLIGALAVASLGARTGRLRAVIATAAASAAAGILLLIPSSWTFTAGALIGSISWAWSTPLMLGFCATLDTRARGATWAAFVAKAGLATGPLLGAAVVTGDRVRPAMLLAVLLAIVSGYAFYRAARSKESA